MLTKFVCIFLAASILLLVHSEIISFPSNDDSQNQWGESTQDHLENILEVKAIQPQSETTKSIETGNPERKKRGAPLSSSDWNVTLANVLNQSSTFYPSGSGSKGFSANIAIIEDQIPSDDQKILIKKSDYMMINQQLDLFEKYNVEQSHSIRKVKEIFQNADL